MSRVFVTGKLFQPSVMKHSSILGSYLSYKENEVLSIWSLCLKIVKVKLNQQYIKKTFHNSEPNEPELPEINGC
jgi:hypothetical protein